MPGAQPDIGIIPAYLRGAGTMPNKLGQVEVLPEIVLYEHINFEGANFRTNLSHLYVGDDWNDRISSFIVVRGVWEIFRHINYGDKLGTGTQRFGPGYYNWVVDVGIPNDHISSFRAVDY